MEVKRKLKLPECLLPGREIIGDKDRLRYQDTSL